MVKSILDVAFIVTLILLKVLFLILTFALYSYRNSILHNICNDMLEKGFHQSFSELFNLVEKQREDHRRAGPAAILLEPLIENNHTKLEHLRVQVHALAGAQYIDHALLALDTAL